MIAPTEPTEGNSRASVLEFDEEGYVESEDEDFDPSKPADDDKEEELSDKSDGDYQEADEEAEKYDYSHIESSEGGLVSTRNARRLQHEREQREKYEHFEMQGVSSRAGELWAQLQEESQARLHDTSSVMHAGGEAGKDRMQEEQIMIERAYWFAGEMVREKKMVLKSSAEAQEYLNSLKFKPKELVPSTMQEMDGGSKLRRPLKRPPILEQIIAGALKPKLTTLEKSKLDWATYVDKEGINEELQLFNKDGYLAKQDFLRKVDGIQNEQYKELRRQELQKNGAQGM
ncbi:AFL017Wp [Eremothecium gossypii ATCC 10895]|uniref:SWR1-complex protein 5 n=1 Tax=Eremothecium gossypii (strain ATCC 10895 / CBS 109.51 / FGSC 9923 / NRRL Y-1056) TaxID=284811 RepID=SWC5_EREGS|nr:AFL017Wp [Eremothecium gossypii ATCC 10895]Q754T8.1 RecName: Full=SWR1-complex protein 5 [Eremothecium gossypii ATCC 10895]AAS53355.1 AFL017Wp [Eremothecium gossypii ATCC 10895]